MNLYQKPPCGELFQGQKGKIAQKQKYSTYRCKRTNSHRAYKQRLCGCLFIYKLSKMGFYLQMEIIANYFLLLLLFVSNRYFFTWIWHVSFVPSSDTVIIQVPAFFAVTTPFAGLWHLILIYTFTITFIIAFWGLFFCQILSFLL